MTCCEKPLLVMDEEAAMCGAAPTSNGVGTVSSSRRGETPSEKKRHKGPSPNRSSRGLQEAEAEEFNRPQILFREPVSTSTTMTPTALPNHDNNNAADSATLRAMLRQEQASYACPDYVQAMRSVMPFLRDDDFLRCDTVSWLYQVVDKYNVSREIVAFVSSYLDRFLALIMSRDHVVVQSAFIQLAALTALRLAVKVYNNFTLPLEHLQQMSSGHFSREMMDNMEQRMLNTLQWRLHPPTAVAFCYEFVQLVVADKPRSQWTEGIREFFEQARFFTELAVRDYSLSVLPCRPSMVAFGAILNALEMTTSPNALPPGFGPDLIQAICSLQNPELYPLHPMVGQVRVKLYYLRMYCTWEEGEDNNDNNNNAITTTTTAAAANITTPSPSPVCVSDLFDLTFAAVEDDNDDDKTTKLTQEQQPLFVA